MSEATRDSFSGWAIYDEHGRPMRSGISFNSEDEAWRCYFCNRSGWERMREFSRQHGYRCVRVTLTPNAALTGAPRVPSNGVVGTLDRKGI